MLGTNRKECNSYKEIKPHEDDPERNKSTK
jgi:hypothetical protein